MARLTDLRIFRTAAEAQAWTHGVPARGYDTAEVPESRMDAVAALTAGVCEAYRVPANTPEAARIAVLVLEQLRALRGIGRDRVVAVATEEVCDG